MWKYNNLYNLFKFIDRIQYYNNHENANKNNVTKLQPNANILIIESATNEGSFSIPSIFDTNVKVLLFTFTLVY